MKKIDIYTASLTEILSAYFTLQTKLIMKRISRKTADTANRSIPVFITKRDRDGYIDVVMDNFIKSPEKPILVRHRHKNGTVNVFAELYFGGAIYDKGYKLKADRGGGMACVIHTMDDDRWIPITNYHIRSLQNISQVIDKTEEASLDDMEAEIDARENGNYIHLAPPVQSSTAMLWVHDIRKTYDGITYRSGLSIEYHTSMRFPRDKRKKAVYTGELLRIEYLPGKPDSAKLKIFDPSKQTDENA